MKDIQIFIQNVKFFDACYVNQWLTVTNQYSQPVVLKLFCCDAFGKFAALVTHQQQDVNEKTYHQSF